MKIIKFLLIIILVLPIYAHEPMNYGWDIPHTPINVGGYIDSFYDKSYSDELVFDDIAMLISANTEKFNFLSEIEISHVSFSTKPSDINLSVERLQANYILSDNETLTVGRFHSDIGYWNQAPINILQATISHPHILNFLFPANTTGLMYNNNWNEENSLSLTFQNNQDLNIYTPMQINRHLAASYHKEGDEFSWRVATGYFREVDNIESTYFGLSFLYEPEYFTLQGELFFHNGDKRYEKPYSGYIQSIYSLGDTHDIVARAEAYKDNALFTEEQVFNMGYVFRPKGNVAFKVEYEQHSKLPLKQFLYSFSVIF